jgi:hypothetical protein
MKLLFAMTVWLLGIGRAWTATTLEQGFTCPIDGQSWKQTIELSGRPTGLRLDLKKLGDVVEPPTLPQCPKCGYVVFSDAIEESVMKKVKAFVLGGDYQMIAAKSPSWACLAQLQDLLGAAPVYIGFSYLRASWQVEEKPALCERYLARAYERFSKVAETLPAGHKDRLNVLLLCGELERRLGKFAEAEARFRDLLVADEFKGEPRREPIATLQLKLIADRERAPHALGTDKAPPRIPLGIAPAAAKLVEEPKEEKKGKSGPKRALDLSAPFPIESGSVNPFPRR